MRKYFPLGFIGFLLACTTGDECQSDDLRCNLPTTGFYVSSSTPAHTQSYVALSTLTITIRMSESVDSTTVDGRVGVFKINGEQETEITSDYTITINEEIITLTRVDNLPDETDFQVRLYPNLAAENGNKLLEGFEFQYYYIDFSTKSENGLGVDGPPSVVSANRSDIGNCFGVIIDFSETLSVQPQIDLLYKVLGINEPWQTIPVYANPAIVYGGGGTMSRWRIDVCNLATLGAVEAKIIVRDYIDLDGENGVEWASDIWSGLF